MSKGNGRSSREGKGNGMDKFNGTCNGVSSNTLNPLSQSENLDDYSNQSKPNSLDSKAGNFKYTNPTNKSIKEFKNKIK